jgi:biopolymer transport protein ExbD
MLPLMDVVFLLLVFFIYSMLIMSAHRGMRLSLPVSASAERESASVTALTVRADGSLFVDREPVAFEELAAVLGGKRELVADENAVSLQVFAEDSLSYQELYRVLDAVKAAGVRKISLQARQEKAR